MSRRGFFIVFEGIDGSGKTTISKMLIKDLEEWGFRAVYTFEPWTSEFVEILKRLDVRDAYIDALVYAVDRLIHIRKFIEPHLAKGYVVVCDRYYYSSIAYQAAMGAPQEWVYELNKYALKPDIAIYLDVTPEIGIERKKGLKSRFQEYEEIKILENARRIYLDMVRRGLLIYVDATRSVEEVYTDVVNIARKHLQV